MANLQCFSNFIPIIKRFQELTTKNHSENSYNRVTTYRQWFIKTINFYSHRHNVITLEREYFCCNVFLKLAAFHHYFPQDCLQS